MDFIIATNPSFFGRLKMYNYEKSLRGMSKKELRHHFVRLNKNEDILKEQVVKLERLVKKR